MEGSQAYPTQSSCGLKLDAMRLSQSSRTLSSTYDKLQVSRVLFISSGAQVIASLPVARTVAAGAHHLCGLQLSATLR